MITATGKGERISAILGLAGAAAATIGAPAYVVGKKACYDLVQRYYRLEIEFFSTSLKRSSSDRERYVVKKELRAVEEDFKKYSSWRSNGISATYLGSLVSLTGLALFISYRRERIEKDGRDRERRDKMRFLEPCSYRNLEYHCTMMHKPHLDGAEINKTQAD